MHVLHAALQAPEGKHDAPPAAGPAPQNSVFLVMLLVGVLFLAVVYPRIRKRRSSSSSGDRPGTFSDSMLGPREELERLLAEIQDLSREQIARLDTKIRLLNQLLLDCDQKKKELEGLLGRTATAGPARIEPSPSTRPANPLHEQVYGLQDSGKTVNDICTSTGLEKGEVELILGLRKMPGKM